MNSRSVFRIAPFDQMVAIEAPLAQRDALERGGFRVDHKDPDATGAKIKLDHQIVLVAKAEEADAVHSDDADVMAYEGKSSLNAPRIADLEVLPDDQQQRFDFED